MVALFIPRRPANSRGAGSLCPCFNLPFSMAKANASAIWRYAGASDDWSIDISGKPTKRSQAYQNGWAHTSQSAPSREEDPANVSALGYFCAKCLAFRWLFAGDIRFCRVRAAWLSGVVCAEARQEK